MRNFRSLLLALAVGTVAAPALAVDGVVLIDQNRALAGGVTSGDAPGFPIWLTSPGSYRLASNLVVSDPTVTAIEIRAPHVSIDLNGFSITGPGTRNNGSRLTGFGITSVIYASNGIPVLESPYASVQNGTVSGMGAGGMLLVRGSTVRNMRVHDNFGPGIEVSSGTDNSLIVDNVLANNILFGSVSGDILAISRVVIRGNTATGTILTGCPAVVIGNVAAQIDAGLGCTRSQNSPGP